MSSDFLNSIRETLAGIEVDHFVQGFDAMRGGSSGKVVLDWT